MTIFEKTPGQLVASGERTVATFESGLVRVDQTYTCATASAATHRATLAIGETLPDGNTAPAIDGLAIFPAPQEIKRPDGFTDFKVSAYGRATTGLQNILIEPQRAFSSPLRYSVWKISGTICIPASQTLTISDLALDSQLFAPFDVVDLLAPNLDVLTITETQVLVPAISEQFITVPVGSGTVTLNTTTSTRRLFTIELTSDGSTVAATYSRWFTDPQLVITATRGFGSFVEMDITTTREAAE